MRKERVLTAVLAMLLVVSGVASAVDYYVNAENGSDSNSGLEPPDAWRTITHALSAVVCSPEAPATIHVAAGTYSASTNGESFPLVMRSYVSLKGEGEARTTLDAEGRAYHVICCYYLTNVGLSGFTVKGGNTNAYRSSWDARGGGISCNSSGMITITRCAIQDNRAYVGAGICFDYCSCAVEDCTISNNVCACDSDGRSWGGGIYCYDCLPTIRSSIVDRNRAAAGAGITVSYCTGTTGNGVGGIRQREPSCTITDCEITDNVGIPNANQHSWGGGIYCYGSSSVISGCTMSGNAAWTGAGAYSSKGSSLVISDCRILNNEGLPDEDGECGGGGIFSTESALSVEDSAIVGNMAWKGCGVFCEVSPSRILNSIIANNIPHPAARGGSWGGGFCCDRAAHTLSNCAITGNSASTGGGIYCVCAQPEFSNCTIAANSAENAVIEVRFVASPIFRNCVIYNQGEELRVIEGSQARISHSCIEGGWEGVGNISADPRFVSGPFGDYYLSCEAAGQHENSRCIDAGSDSALNLGLGQLTTRTDSEADAGVVDMGYHYPIYLGGPTIECSLNASSFRPGDYLVGSLKVANDGPDMELDVYVAFVLPDGAIFCITPHGGLTTELLPWLQYMLLPRDYSFGPAPMLESIVPEGIPDGDCLFAAAFSRPERFEVIGEMSLFGFTISD